MASQPDGSGRNRGSITNRQCRNCGAYVSNQFARVFGNNQNRVYACLDCSTTRDLREGVATEG
ncbi:DUF7563 family protein [Halostella pelagica]